MRQLRILCIIAIYMTLSGILAVSAPASEQRVAAAGAQDDPVRGRRLYQSRCIACHSLDSNRVGPMHRGVYGRRAGGVAGYAYSPALRDSAVVWDDDTLDLWLQDPEGLIDGQRMNFRVKKPQDRRDIISYLKHASQG